jgi:hypothetical protein
MSKLAIELNDLPVESVDVLPAAMLEELETGHGMTEIGASCPLCVSLCFSTSCGPCYKPDDEDIVA